MYIIYIYIYIYVIFLPKQGISLLSCLRRISFHKSHSLFSKSKAAPCSAASGGNFSPQLSHVSLNVWCVLAQLPPAVIFQKQMIPFSLKGGWGRWGKEK